MEPSDEQLDKVWRALVGNQAEAGEPVDWHAWY